MKPQIIEKHGKKEFAVIPYKDFLRMQEDIEDYNDLKALRKAKVDPMNQQGRPFDDVAKELGLKKKSLVTIACHKMSDDIASHLFDPALNAEMFSFKLQD